MNRILLSGGGTGGHINPAIAIGIKIKEKNPNAVIEYVGTEKGLEKTLVPKAGFPIHYVDVVGIKRKLSIENISALIKAISSVYEAKRIIREFKPDLVIGTGGYVCWPVLKAASQLGIPTAVHESNAYPGLTVRKLEKYVDRILVNFEQSKGYFSQKEKVIQVGNPVKPEMLKANKEEKRKALGIPQDIPMILSYGGSLGARRVNETVLEMIKRYSLREDIYHIHATGDREWDHFAALYEQSGFTTDSDNNYKKKNVFIKQYIYDMPSYMAAADIVICRGGAMTITELAIMGKASIIIPSPNVTDNHQYKNAQVLERAGAAVVIEEKDLSPERLVFEAEKLVSNQSIRMDMENKARNFAITDSLDKIYNVLEEIVKK